VLVLVSARESSPRGWAKSLKYLRPLTWQKFVKEKYIFGVLKICLVNVSFKNFQILFIYFFDIFLNKSQMIFKNFKKKFRDYFKIIYGSLTFFLTISFSIWIVDLYYKILTRY
jgi:hypothetical protein